MEIKHGPMVTAVRIFRRNFTGCVPYRSTKEMHQTSSDTKQIEIIN